jgi:DNA-binding response OmpR family regulator
MNDFSVLIVEDDPALLRGLRDNFAAAGYHVATAADGQQGLEAATRRPPDLLILDVMLPRLNGYEVCRSLRAAGCELPIIMLTAKGQEEDLLLGLNLGADDYVTKPFSIRELLARAGAFLRRRAAQQPAVHTFGDCQVDTAAQRLLRQGKEVPLTSKEYRLLAHFLERPGRALSRQEILNAVWGRAVIVTGRSVDRCVTTLRAKIEPDPRVPTFIQTVRDVGYRFEPGH